jgi:hypothetical protein
LILQVRPAMLSVEARAIYDEMEPLVYSDTVSWEQYFPGECRAWGGEEIEPLEWEEDWAEGEKFSLLSEGLSSATESFDADCLCSVDRPDRRS